MEEFEGMVEYLDDLEEERGCGYRRVGKLYVRGAAAFKECDRLPILLSSCPVCGGGIRFSRGWIKIMPKRLFGKHGQYEMHCPNCGAKMVGREMEAYCPECRTIVKTSEYGGCVDENCGFCHNPPETAYMLWVGEKFYTPESFLQESKRLGISKAVATIPKDLIVGETVVYLAHRKAVKGMVADSTTLTGYKEVEFPGVFATFVPTHFERLVKRSDFERNKEKYKEEMKRGIKIIVVPDDYEDRVAEAMERKGRKKRKKKTGEVDKHADESDKV